MIAVSSHKPFPVAAWFLPEGVSGWRLTTPDFESEPEVCDVSDADMVLEVKVQDMVLGDLTLEAKVLRRG